MPDSSKPFTHSAVDDPALLRMALAAQKDDYLRLAADYDSYRKRTQRDAMRQAAIEKESFIRDLLPVLDNLERALASEGTASHEQLYQGVEMTLQQLRGLLRHHGVEAVDAVGKPFNSHRHEAVAIRYDPRRPDDIILEVVQRGYYRGDTVFRPAKVIVNDRNPSFGVLHGS
ncbi:MAG: heat-shock protein [Chthoniobacteraceae bacterium]|nr:heat-shock protein [Chthoniobacteraceae bacterium]